MGETINKFPDHLTLYREEVQLDNVKTKFDGLTGKEIDENMIFLHKENLDLLERTKGLEAKITELEGRVSYLENALNSLYEKAILSIESGDENQIKIDIENIDEENPKAGKKAKVSFSENTYFIAE